MASERLHTGRVQLVSRVTTPPGTRAPAMNRGMEWQRNRRCGTSRRGSRLLLSHLIRLNHHTTGCLSAARSCHIIRPLFQMSGDKMRLSDTTKIG